MLSKVEKRVSITEVIANKIALWVKERNRLEEIDYLKMKLGVGVILTNITKGIIVYGLAILLNIFFETLILHGSYFLLRRSSFGLHAKSSTICTLLSIVLFVVIPYMMKDIVINNYILLPLFLVCIFFVYLFAPADTEKHPLLGKNRRKKLRNQSVITCMVLMLIAVIVPMPMISTLVFTGVAIQVISILPVSYKLLKRSYDNYEQYEEQAS
ncbi:accessory gene regulator B family protein [Gracilibacillus alcaliphilus]|uniref:accessory gene regulator B family protein n=1 Tax=Gracilibacillus alcaliphilus TaxID=1401441 RepID=UPI00195B3F19|nr:accessory gene regulator B family protein [Gracilibacillus alcaliphilus]MBM7676058.1 accessory gene regulator B [Gracilibacillus alcaliphilus]